MAKVKTAKQKITEFLKTKGLNADEVKDAFDELDAADTDLDSLAAELTQYKTVNSQWDDAWKNNIAPALANLTQERDTLKGQFQKLQETLGIPGGEPGKPVTKAGDATYVTPDQLEQFRMGLAQASSDTMKQLIRVSQRHFMKFKAEPDLDAIEKLMAEKDNYGRSRYNNVEDAYTVWAKPQYEKSQKDETDRLIMEGIKAGVQAEMSKQGISSRKRKSDPVLEEAEPVAVAAKIAKKDWDTPEYDRKLREGWVKDMDEMDRGVVH